MLVAAIIATAATQGVKRAIKLWPAIAIALPWLIARWTHQIPTDLAQGSMITRVIEHIKHPDEYAQLLVIGNPLMWIGVALSIVCAWRRWKRERFLLLVVALQLSFYLLAYLVTPLDLEFHIKWSWDRLVSHIEPVIVFIALATALPLVRQPVRPTVTESPSSASAAA